MNRHGLGKNYIRSLSAGKAPHRPRQSRLDGKSWRALPLRATTIARSDCRLMFYFYSKRPFAGPEAVLAYLSRYTYRVAIANSRLIALGNAGVTFRWKHYRATGRARFKIMTLAADEFIRRFLLHVLPSGFHRIHHYGLFANSGRAENIARARQLLNAPTTPRQTRDADGTDAGEPSPLSHPCPCCGGRMIIIETFERGRAPRYRPTVAIRIDTS
jgi:hypothetical protein